MWILCEASGDDGRCRSSTSLLPVIGGPTIAVCSSFELSTRLGPGGFPDVVVPIDRHFGGVWVIVSASIYSVWPPLVLVGAWPS